MKYDFEAIRAALAAVGPALDAAEQSVKSQRVREDALDAAQRQVDQAKAETKEVVARLTAALQAFADQINPILSEPEQPAPAAGTA